MEHVENPAGSASTGPSAASSRGEVGSVGTTLASRSGGGGGGGASGGGGSGGGRGRQPRSSRAQVITIVVALVVAVVASGGIALLIAKHGQAQPSTAIASLRPSGIPATVSTPTAELMALSPVPKRAAPGFTLEDQYGKVSSLSSFKGKVIILEFMDPHCTDICPLVSQEFIDAYHDLGATASKVVFAAVNVNQYYASPASMLTFSKEHSLISIPSWHFFTGATPSLKKVWHDYNISVRAPNPNADIIHTSLVYFIDPSGHERYLAAPQVDHTKSGKAWLPASQLSQWGQGIAEVARHLAG